MQPWLVRSDSQCFFKNIDSLFITPELAHQGNGEIAGSVSYWDPAIMGSDKTYSYFPKSINFDQVRHIEIKQVMDKLNRRPGKTLGFKTPSEVFACD